MYFINLTDIKKKIMINTQLILKYNNAMISQNISKKLMKYKFEI